MCIKNGSTSLKYTLSPKSENGILHSLQGLNTTQQSGISCFCGREARCRLQQHANICSAVSWLHTAPRNCFTALFGLRGTPGKESNFNQYELEHFSPGTQSAGLASKGYEHLSPEEQGHS